MINRMTTVVMKTRRILVLTSLFVLMYNSVNIGEYLGLVQYRIDKNSPIFFIGGVPSSGTTLLRVMLDAHASIRCGPESRVIPQMLQLREAWELSPDYMLQLADAGVNTDVMDTAFQMFILEIMTSHGYPAKYIGDKDPFNLKYMIYLRYLFPNSKYILMVRDGRAVVHSLMSRGVSVTVRDFDITNQTNSLINWNKLMSEMYAQCVRVGANICLPVYYEQLVLFPEKWMRMILNFLDIPWDPAVLRHHQYVDQSNGAILSKFEKSTDQIKLPLQQESIWKWSRHFTMDSEKVKTLAPMLEILGYDTDHEPPVYTAMSSNVKDNLLHLTQNKYFYRKKMKNIFDKTPYNTSLPIVRYS